MDTPAFEEIAETFDFLDDWEDRYRHVIELGKAMPAMDAVLQVPATKVEGCASQVWIMPRIEDGRFDFQGDSDALIVRGLIAILHALYSGVPVTEVNWLGDVPFEGEIAINARIRSTRPPRPAILRATDQLSASPRYSKPLLVSTRAEPGLS